MKNAHKGFIGAIVLIVIVLGLLAGGSYLYFNKNKVQTQVLDTVEVSVPDGFSSYSNKAFSAIYPEDWISEEYTGSTSDSSCNALGVYFVPEKISSQILADSSSDYLHYLKSSNAVISIKGGLGETRPSLKYLKDMLSTQSESIVKSTFSSGEMSAEMNIMSREVNLDDNIPSITYHYELPKYNKKGSVKFIVVNTEPSPVLLRIDYIASEKDFSESLFTTVASSVRNLTSKESCLK